MQQGGGWRRSQTHQNTTTSNYGTNECVELLVTANGKLQVTWGDTLDLEVL